MKTAMGSDSPWQFFCSLHERPQTKKSVGNADTLFLNPLFAISYSTK